MSEEFNSGYMFEELRKNMKHIRKNMETIEKALVISEFYNALDCPEEMKMVIVMLEFYGDSDFIQNYCK